MDYRMHDFLINLPKVVFPLIGVVLLVKVAPRRGLGLRDDVGFRSPPPASSALWLGAWLALTVVEEVIGRRLGIGLAKPWPHHSGIVIAERVLAIGILGPIAEEVAFRGLFLGWLRRHLQPYVAVTIVAACWAGFHFGAEPATLLLIFTDGLLLGFSRLSTRSLWVPITMHIAGNLYSIYQSLQSTSGL